MDYAKDLNINVEKQFETRFTLGISIVGMILEHSNNESTFCESIRHYFEHSNPCENDEQNKHKNWK